MFRFSHLAVPVGKVPSGGSALTGSASPVPAMISPRTLADEGWSLFRHRRQNVKLAGHLPGYGDLMQMCDRGIHSGKILLHHGVAALPVSLLNGLLDRGDSFLARQHSADSKEASLHDGVDAVSHAGFARDRIRVNDVELEMLVQNLLLCFPRQVVPDLLGAEGGIQQERRSRFGRNQHVHALEK